MNATTKPVIHYQPCQSSQIEALGYDTATQTLGVRFVRGATYHYTGVPREVAHAFLQAESAGKFFGANIKNKFAFERQPDEAGVVFGLSQAQEPKYTVTQHGRLVNRETGKAIPDDEPVFVLRAQDRQAADAIAAYLMSLEDDAHATAVQKRLDAFRAFAEASPGRMKEPSTLLPVTEPASVLA